jgi:hypothetical protein
MIRSLWLKFLHLPHLVKLVIVAIAIYLVVWHGFFLYQILFPFDNTYHPYTCGTFDVDGPCSLGAWYWNSSFLAGAFLTIVPVWVLLAPAPFFVDTHLNFSNIVLDMAAGLYLCAAALFLVWPLFRKFKKNKLRNTCLVLLIATIILVGRGMSTTLCPTGMDAFTAVHIPYRSDTEVYRGDTYDKDKNHVFYRCEVIDGADPKTFETIYHPYAKDANSVFYETKNLYVDSQSFVLFRNKEIYNELIGYGVEGIARGGDKIFSRGTVVGGVDVETFEFLNKAYFRDKNQVYWFDKPLEGADPATFEIVFDKPGLDGYDAQDKNHKYFYGEIVTH